MKCLSTTLCYEHEETYLRYTHVSILHGIRREAFIHALSVVYAKFLRRLQILEVVAAVRVDGDGDIIRRHLRFAQERRGELKCRFKSFWHHSLGAGFFKH